MATLDAKQLMEMVTERALRRYNLSQPALTPATSIPPSPDTGKPFDPLDATCWFIATKYAEMVFDLRLKDLAMEILEGNVIAGPIETEEHVQAWIDELMEIHQDEPEAEWMTELGRRIDIHFGLE